MLCPEAYLQCAAQQARHLVYDSREVTQHQLLGAFQERLFEEQGPEWGGSTQHPLADVAPGHGCPMWRLNILPIRASSAAQE